MGTKRILTLTGAGLLALGSLVLLDGPDDIRQDARVGMAKPRGPESDPVVRAEPVQLQADRGPGAEVSRSRPDPRLQAELRRLRAEVDAIKLAAQPPSDPTPLPAPELTTEEQAARAQEQIAGVEQTLGDQLLAEGIDPAWAYDNEVAIVDVLADPAFTELRLDDVRCGATLCRLGVSVSDEASNVDALVEELTSAPPFRHGGFVTYTGERELTMFVAREGHPLPPPPRT